MLSPPRLGATLRVAPALADDIVNVLESLEVVLKDKASRYKWLGNEHLPQCIATLEREFNTGSKLSTSKLTVPLLQTGVESFEKENIDGHEGDGRVEVHEHSKEKEGRKEKSIRELSIKFINLFMQAVNSPSLGGVLSLEQAARSLLVQERGGREPDTGAMKTKVRRLYDICNVLTSLCMIEKVKLPGTHKPAFKWLGITKETYSVFDPSAAKSRVVRQYGGPEAIAHKNEATPAPRQPNSVGKRVLAATSEEEARRVLARQQSVWNAAAAAQDATCLQRRATVVCAAPIPGVQTQPMQMRANAAEVPQQRHAAMYAVAATVPLEQKMSGVQLAHKAPGVQLAHKAPAQMAVPAHMQTPVGAAKPATATVPQNDGLLPPVTSVVRVVKNDAVALHHSRTLNVQGKLAPRHAGLSFSFPPLSVSPPESDDEDQSEPQSEPRSAQAVHSEQPSPTSQPEEELLQSELLTHTPRGKGTASALLCLAGFTGVATPTA